MDKMVKCVVENLRNKGVSISDNEAEYVLMYCNRKMDACKIEKRENYLPLLFVDEIKNYLFRRTVNAKVMLRELEKKLRRKTNV